MSITTTQDLFSTIESLAARERNAIATHEHEAVRTQDPRLQELWHRLADLRRAISAELDAYIAEARPRSEITQQINAMFDGA